MLLRLACAAAAIAGGLIGLAPSASAHALLRSSEPGDGVALGRAPGTVRLVFTESPDLALSTVRVLGSAGESFEEGRPSAAAETLTVRVKDLPVGSYTVSWRVVSKVDGHTTAGSFAFGVGVAPAEPTTMPAAQTPRASPIGAATRWVLYLGLSVMVGFAWVGGFAFASPRGDLLRALPLGWGLALLGIAGIGAVQYLEAGVGIGTFLGTSLGRALVLRALPLVLAAPVLLALRRRPARPLVALLLSAATLTMLVHAATGHAAAGTWPGAKIAIQWVHFLSAAAWIGGLAALVVGVKGAPGDVKAAGVRRFSMVAGVAFLALAGTGVARAVNEVGSLGRLPSTSFGRLALIKGGLLLTLGILGAVNRYRNVPRASRSLQGVRRVGSAEVALGAVTLAVSGLLAVSPPARTLAAQSGAAKRLVVSGADFATSVRARLDITPGVPGPNRFSVRLSDFDRGDAVRARRVSLRLASLSRREVGEATLELNALGRGRYTGRGSLAFPGRWSLTLLVERPSDAVEVGLEAAIPSAGIRVDRAPGQPAIYTAQLPAGRSLQLFVDPERPGGAGLHATYFGEDGTELAVDAPEMIGLPPRGPIRRLNPRRFGPGHFVADVRLDPGRWAFEVSSSAAGERLLALVSVSVAQD